MAQRLAALDFKPDLLLSSSALRTRLTATEISKVLELDLTLQPDLYLASLKTLLARVAETSQEYRCPALVGHNPGLTELLEFLTGSNIENIPTAGFAVIQLPINDWPEISAGCGELLLFDYPKLHK